VFEFRGRLAAGLGEIERMCVIEDRIADANPSLAGTTLLNDILNATHPSLTFAISTFQCSNALKR